MLHIDKRNIVKYENNEIKGGFKMKRIILVSIVFLIFTSLMSLNAQWARTYGGSYTDYAQSIQQTSDGGYIVAGYTLSFGAENDDIWVLKLSSTGTVDWQKTYGGSSDDYAQSIQQTSDGGYIVAGYTLSFGAGGSDIWVLKLSSSGTIEWQKTYGGGSGDYAPSIQQTSDGGYIIAGITSSFGAGGGDVWVLKLSSTGTVEWQKRYGGSLYDRSYSIQQTSDGGYIIASITSSFGAGSSDIWVLKLSSTGTIEWQKTYGGRYSDYPQSIQQTSDGGYIVAGITFSFGAGGWDIWVLKLSSTGTVEWQKKYGGSSSDYSYSIQQTSDGGYVVAGATTSFGLGSADVWVLKLSSTGTIDWQRTYGGSGFQEAYSIQKTSDGGYIIAGHDYLFDAGGEDAFLVLKVYSDGDIDSSCGFIGSSNATITDSSVSPVGTNIAPQDTGITALNTNVSPQDTSAIVKLLCEAPKYTLVISSADRGTTDPAPGSYIYYKGVEAKIEAIPDAGCKFVYWSGDVLSGHEKENPATITMNSDKSIKANFQYALILQATVEINPGTLNLKSQSDKNAITVYIELPAGYDAGQINVATVSLVVNGVTIAAQTTPTSVGDYDGDNIPDRMVKLNRQSIITALASETGDVSMMVTGRLKDGLLFSGADTIKIIKPGK